MKIGIVTLPLHTNYGGILQAYALQTVLERIGFEVEHLQPEVIYPQLHPTWKMPLVYCKRAIRKYLGGELKLPVFLHPQKWIRKNTDKFVVKHIKCRYIKKNEWNDVLSYDYDVFIFGSDQVWRPLYAIPIEKYFGSFLINKNIKRIAYAASFGTNDNEYTLDQIINCSFLLKQFNTVSVRELSGVDLCKRLFDVDAKHVLDPTMLLSKDDYIELIDLKKKNRLKGRIAVYVLDSNPEVDLIIEKISKIKGLKAYKINSKCEDYNAPLSQRQQPPLENWLKAFNDAEFVVTDSFHGTVLSILFHKPFVCIANSFRGASRFHSLLGMFGLVNRLITISNNNDYNIELSDFDWEKVDNILSQKRTESKLFLERSLM